jgi:CubicO group peptidase (beta-lactamase class C family)
MFKETGALALTMATGAALSVLIGAEATQASTTAAGDRARLPALLHRLTTDDGTPGALLHLRHRRGSTVLTSGVADVTSQAPVPPDSRFRIGSMTKPFVATVVLQLVGEHRVSLDAPVERYLPGIVRGNGNDGLESRPLPCGGLYWGHGGDIFGYETVGGATVNGSQATVMANLDPGGSDAPDDDMRTAVEAALCQAR